MSWSRFTGRLWSHSDFLKLWTGQSISELGSHVSLALWVGAIGTLPAFLFVFLSPVRSIQAIPNEAAASTRAAA